MNSIKGTKKPKPMHLHLGPHMWCPWWQSHSKAEGSLFHNQQKEACMLTFIQREICLQKKMEFEKSRGNEAEDRSCGSLGILNFAWSIPSIWQTRRSAISSTAASCNAHSAARSLYWSDRCLRYSKRVASFSSMERAFASSSFFLKHISHWVNLS